MDKINWSSKYSVGIGIIDEQHKRIILMINKIIKEKDANTGSEVISELITRMMQYAREHFKTEENLLIEHGYPYFEEHKSEHMAYHKKAVAFTVATPMGIEDVPEKMKDFLITWWENHILVEDMKYKDFFSKIPYLY